MAAESSSSGRTFFTSSGRNPETNKNLVPAETNLPELCSGASLAINFQKWNCNEIRLQSWYVDGLPWLYIIYYCHYYIYVYIFFV